MQAHGANVSYRSAFFGSIALTITGLVASYLSLLLAFADGFQYHQKVIVYTAETGF